MLEFKPLTMKDMPEVSAYLWRTESFLCDHMPATIFMWRHYFKTQFVIAEDALFFRVEYPGGNVAYTVPVARDLKRALLLLSDYVTSCGERLILSPVSKAQLDAILDVYPEAKWSTDRDWSDYIYDAAKMQTFSGKKLHGQRNHLNKFHSVCLDSVVEPITRENLPLCRAFLEEYAGEVERSEGAKKELSYARDVLDSYEEYGQLGTCILTGGRVIAFAVGNIRGDMLFEHIEKATRTIPGAYQKIASEFAKMYAHPAREGVVRINREDDMGDLALRQSKMAYHPIELLEKYTVRFA